MFCFCMSARTYVFIYVCTYVCMYECMYACMIACMHAYMYVRLHACMYVCTYLCMYFCDLSVTRIFVLIQHLHKQELYSYIFRFPADVTLDNLHLQVLTRYISYVSNAHWTIGTTATCSICHSSLISHASLTNFSISELHTISVFSVYGAAKSNCFGVIC